MPRRNQVAVWRRRGPFLLSAVTPVTAGKVQCLELLIQHGASVNVQNTFGETPRHLMLAWKNNSMSSPPPAPV
jgi:hypothetical protein